MHHTIEVVSPGTGRWLNSRKYINIIHQMNRTKKNISKAEETFYIRKHTQVKTVDKIELMYLKVSMLLSGCTQIPFGLNAEKERGCPHLWLFIIALKVLDNGIGREKNTRDTNWERIGPLFVGNKSIYLKISKIQRKYY